MADIRLDNRGAWLVDRIVATDALVLKSVDGDRAGEAAINRYLGNDAVDPATILAPAIARTAKAAEGWRGAAGRRCAGHDRGQLRRSALARLRHDLRAAAKGSAPAATCRRRAFSTTA